VVSYLAAEPSRDLVVAAHQRITSQWWSQRTRFRLFVSELVIQEAAAGDPGLAGRRLERIAGLGVLKIRDDAVRLAEALVDQGPIPVKASADALHIALAAAHGIDFVLTWNMRHIANAAMRVGIERTCRANGFEPPVLCTPEELLGE
jgi:hypothetical protein